MAKTKKSVLTPSVTTLVKLGSIAVHCEEMLSPNGHEVDRHALEAVLRDPEVVAWLAGMSDIALIPLKR